MENRELKQQGREIAKKLVEFEFASAEVLKRSAGLLHDTLQWAADAEIPVLESMKTCRELKRSLDVAMEQMEATAVVHATLNQEFHERMNIPLECPRAFVAVRKDRREAKLKLAA